MKNNKIFALIIFICLPLFSYTQTTPFSRGVNLTNWFQASNARQIQFTKFTKQDFTNIKSLGCDVIRLPINLHYMTNGDPNYILDPLFLTMLDSVVDWAEELEIHLLFDNHTFSPSVDTDPAVESILIKVWTQMAEHYKDRSEYIYYEVLNEPHGISDALWGNIQGNVIDAIRTIDTKHTIIVGPAEWNSYNNLNNMPIYEDDNLIYTFHFYDPFLFTHQGADWTDVSMAPATGIPFPYDADRMPDVPPELVGTWVGNSYNSYPVDGTGEKVRELLDIAIEFSNTRNVPVYCGEFGVYNINSPHADRVAWYDSVQNYLDNNAIAWTIWDYTGGFGLFEPGGNDLFDYDLDTALLRGLDLNVPPQQEFVSIPDSTGFPIYTDYIANKIVESCNPGEGTIDFYNMNHPNNDQYCIYWTGGEQYTSIGFDLRPNRDLTVLVDSGFAVDFLVRSNSPGASLDIRFLDTDSDIPEDLPWRIRYTINEAITAWDGVWHHLHIPLSEFTEQGAWDGEWHNPIGEYDWSAVDRFEIVAEHHSYEGIYFWFDNILVTNMDTAQVWDNTVITYLNKIDDNKLPEINAFPNPFSDIISLNYTLHMESHVQIKIYDITGNLIFDLLNETQAPGNYSVDWNGKSTRGTTITKGLYYCYFNTGNQHQVIKIVRI